MARVTYEEVREIFDTTLGPDKLTACITAATNLVDHITAADATPAMSTAELKEVERWLAAHFGCIQDPISLRSKIGDSDAWHFPAAVTTAWGKNLNLTPYGQQAVAMDRTGFLANLGLMKGKFRASPRENSDRFTDNLT